MTKAIRIYQTGGPEVMQLEDVTLAEPGAGQIRVRHKAIAINFADTYVRSGANAAPLPGGMGTEAAGIVEAVGPDVTKVKVGDRIWYSGQRGSYAEARLIAADAVTILPDGIDERTAAGAITKGITSWFLLHQTYQVKPGDTILIHAAAGGIGSIMSQWARHLGCTVIGTVSTEAKARIAKANGCDHVFLYDGFAKKVREIAKGGLPVVYDSIGKDTFEQSLDCLRPYGLLVSFGNASGHVTGVNLSILADKGSLYVTRPTMRNHGADKALFRHAIDEVFKVLQSGAVQAAINQTYALKDAAQAHRDIEDRRTSGSSVLLP